jgi:MerR family transcriptional regulator/heat shock protein HspR
MSKETRRAVFVISVVAVSLKKHPQTLRIYERKGLIEPFRTSGGTRRYSQEDIDRLNQIQELTEQGLNLEGVKQVIEYQDQISKLEKRVASLEAKLEALQREAERRVNEVHRSYRHEIVLRSAMLPDVSRD